MLCTSTNVICYESPVFVVNGSDFPTDLCENKVPRAEWMVDFDPTSTF